jgi:hypothetical protein
MDSGGQTIDVVLRGRCIKRGAGVSTASSYVNLSKLAQEFADVPQPAAQFARSDMIRCGQMYSDRSRIKRGSWLESAVR